MPAGVMVLDRVGRIMSGRSAEGRAMRLKLSQDRQGPPCDDWESTQFVEVNEKNAGRAT